MKTTLKRLVLGLLILSIVLSLSNCRKATGEGSDYSAYHPDVSDSSSDSDSSSKTDISSDEESSDPSSEEDASGNSVPGSVTSSSDSGSTVFENTGPNTPTTSTTTNTENGHTITATYEWHPGLPDQDVSYAVAIKVDGAPVNASMISVVAKTSGVKISGNTVTLPYSVRQANDTVTVTATHSSGVSCNINIPCYKWTQTFNDDFNGNELDRTKWKEHSAFPTTPPDDAASYEIVDRAKAAADCYEVKDGKLYMLIKDEPVYDKTNKTKYLYSECCLDTQGMFMQTYGLFEARIACAPFGGINTAFWLLPNGGYSTQYTNFMADDPRWGLAEIDIIEASVAFGNKDRKTFCISEHFYDYTNNYTHKQQSKYYQVGDTITNFHTYSCVWTADALYYYVDGALIRSTAGLQAESAGGKSVQRAYMIIDVSLYLDNAWVGKRDFTASDLPIAGTVDWVRAYKKG